MTATLPPLPAPLPTPAPVDHIADADKMVSQWVSVDERLPDEDYEMPVWTTPGPRLATFWCGCWRFTDGSETQATVTHYMPVSLPAPPAAQGADVKPKLTPWYPASVKPVRVGVYEKDADPHMRGGDKHYQYWNGSEWGSYDTSISRADQHGDVRSRHQNIGWRGLTAQGGKP